MGYSNAAYLPMHLNRTAILDGEKKKKKSKGDIL